MKDKLSFKINLQLFSDKTKFSVITDNAGEEKDICLDTPIAIMDEQDNTKKSGWYKQKVSKVDAINGNVRLYPRPVYEPALDSL